MWEIFAIMAYTGKLRSIGVRISHQFSISYELSSPEKGGGGGNLLEDLRYTFVHILRDVNKRGTFLSKMVSRKNVSEAELLV